MSPSALAPLAGTLPTTAMLIDVTELVTAYYRNVPDQGVAAHQVVFGTSGHRGSALQYSFNEWHVLAITQAICDYRRTQDIGGPLFLGIDTHAVSIPACASALEVLAANGVDVMLAEHDKFTPTPVISHAILVHNRAQSDASGRADGIVITPSHNPPEAGGIKYNLVNGGPADSRTTAWIETAANGYLKKNLAGVRRMTHAAALRAATTHRHDYLNTYVADLGNVLDMAAIHEAGLTIGVDPLGGAGVHYWAPLAEQYGLNLIVTNDQVDPTFRFVNLDWDGQIRMDPSSPYAMQSLIARKDDFDISFACDTDHDRHGIVTRHAGLLPTNHYLSAAINYLFTHRPAWRANAAVGKSVVMTQMIDRVAAKLKREVSEMPVGFKWFADGLFNGSLAFCGEESAGATFARRDGTVWTTDKDGIVSALLAAEITARTGHDPGDLYDELAAEFGDCYSERIDTAATMPQKRRLASISPAQITCRTLAGDEIVSVMDHALGNHEAIGGIKVTTKEGWFAARPSGTEDVLKTYAESFLGEAHLRRILAEAQVMVEGAIAADSPLTTALTAPVITPVIPPVIAPDSLPTR